MVMDSQKGTVRSSRVRLIEKVGEQESHNRTFKTTRFLLDYFMLWDEKSTHYQRGSPEMEPTAYALVMAETPKPPQW